MFGRPSGTKICSIDGEGKFARVNPAVVAAWGYEPAELTGKGLLEFLPEEDRARFQKTIEKIKAGELQQSFDGRLRRKDGGVIDLSWSAQWSEADNAPFCVAHDVTKQKELDRLKKEFVAMITHDLRAPLSGILFSTGLMKEGAYGEQSESSVDELTTIEGAVEQMLDPSCNRASLDDRTLYWCRSLYALSLFVVP